MKQSARILLGILLFTSIHSLKAQASWEEVSKNKEGTLNVLYFEHQPFTYMKDGELTGIEVDILEYFVQWVKETKGVNLTLNYKDYDGFEAVYDRIKIAVDNTIGLGTVTITPERREEVNLSAPYLKNVSVLISHGHIPTARNESDIKQTFSSLYPTTIKGSIHEKHLKSLRKTNELHNSDILFVGSPITVVKTIAENGKYYGYTDLITFWRFIKQNDHYVKMHKVANIDDERFGFAFPKNSDWVIIFNEFMESGFGFTATKDYHKILEKHLGFEIIEKVEID